MTHHGQLPQRDFLTPHSTYHNSGKFGRLFPTLPPFATDSPELRDALVALGAPGGPMDAQDPPPPAQSPNNPENARIPAGFTFLGQFLDHDITFDPTSSLERQSDPESIANFRTPLLELDSVYGSGPVASPHLYDRTQFGKLLLEKLDPADPNSRDDLPRNGQQTALTGDPRNDENVIVAQLHLAFLKFHNAVLADVAQDPAVPASEKFNTAQRLVRWHYQWMVLNEFLPLLVGEQLVSDILNNGRKLYDWQHEPFIPVEFAVSAYRFGHSQVRSGYRISSTVGKALFGPAGNDLRGGRRDTTNFVDFALFFDVPGQPPAQRSKQIDQFLSTALFALPFVANPDPQKNPASLAQRNLLRHLTFGLPSGQSVARAMGVTELTAAELAELGTPALQLLQSSTPLWYYILKEAKVRAQGATLGPVGGRIVAEVFIGILQGDRFCYLNQHPNWKPLYANDKGTFGMVELLAKAGVVTPSRAAGG